MNSVLLKQFILGYVVRVFWVRDGLSVAITTATTTTTTTGTTTTTTTIHNVMQNNIEVKTVVLFWINFALTAGSSVFTFKACPVPLYY
jgi:hypothetical protein